jgi:hypothetical protein
MLSRNTDNPEKAIYYKKYCKVLSAVIKLEKKLYYSNLISNSKKIKTSWNIIRSVTHINHDKNTKPIINIEGKLCNNAQIMANSINNYFSNQIPQMQCTIPTNVQDALNYLFKIFKHPFQNINMTQVTYKKIKDIVGVIKREIIAWI